MWYPHTYYKSMDIRSCVELSSIAIQVYGGMRYVEETGVAQYLRDSRIAPIMKERMVFKL